MAKEKNAKVKKEKVTKAKNEEIAEVKKEEKETKKVVKKTAKPKKVKKEGFFKGLKKEMSLVKWPTFKEVLKNTVATLLLCIVICAFFLLLNLVLSIIKGWFV